ncbi:MAG: flagellar protein FlgN [Thermotogae bacterium]|nr:flagellar protein FlgN [Thermotogota bacterium]
MNEIIGVLDEEIKLLEELVGILKEKRETIVARDFQLLENITLKEENKLQEVSTLEKRREKLLEKFAKERGMKTVKTVSELLDTLDEEEKEKVLFRVARMLEITNEIWLINRGIENMINFELEYIDTIFKGLINATPHVYDARTRDVKFESHEGGWHG